MSEIDVEQDIARMRAELRSRYTANELVVHRQADVLGYLGMGSLDEKAVKAPATKVGDFVEEVRAGLRVTFREMARPHLKAIFRLLDEIADENKRLAAYEDLGLVIFSTVIYGSLEEDTPFDELNKMVKAANVVKNKAFFKRRQKMMPFIMEIKTNIGPHLEHKALVKKKCIANSHGQQEFQSDSFKRLSAKLKRKTCMPF